MMKKNISILFILMFSSFCFPARNFSSLIKDLRKSGVDTIEDLRTANIGNEHKGGLSLW